MAELLSKEVDGADWAYWALDLQELIAALRASRGGLASREAVSRLKRAGPNTLAEDAAANAWGLFVRQLANPLVLILVFGAFVSMVLREWMDASIILSIVLGSALLGFWQEYRVLGGPRQTPTAACVVRAGSPRRLLDVGAGRDHRAR